jgi:hypothetical protein
MWHDVHTKFREDWFRHSRNIKGLPTGICDAVMLVLPTGRI